MYQKADFLRRFETLDNEALLDKLANSPLTDAARSAILELLADRGLSAADIDAGIGFQRQAVYRRTGATNDCDFCGNSALLSGLSDGGQRFCSVLCLEQARCLEASANISDEDILVRARSIRIGPCPKCVRRAGVVEVRRHYWVWSALLISRWGHDTTVQCADCGRKDNLFGMLSSLTLGPWGIGIVLMPVQIARNLFEMLRDEPQRPSAGLLRLARLRLGRERSGRPPVPGLPF